MVELLFLMTNPPNPLKLASVVTRQREGVAGMTYKVSVIIERDEFGYYAFCPELEGCQSQGDSLDEVMKNIKEAIELYMETLSEEEIKQSISKEILTTTLEVKVV